MGLEIVVGSDTTGTKIPPAATEGNQKRNKKHQMHKTKRRKGGVLFCFRFVFPPFLLGRTKFIFMKKCVFYLK